MEPIQPRPRIHRQQACRRTRTNESRLLPTTRLPNVRVLIVESVLTTARGRTRICQAAIFFVATGSLLLTTACSNDKAPPPNVERPDSAPNPLPRFLRGTIRYEAELEGYGAGLANGYGIIVGLNGTGSSDIPIPVRTMLEQEAAKRSGTTNIDKDEQLNIRQLLNSDNTAVVIVEGVVPAGATDGSKFDLAVHALPGTSTTSLEGGKLWTTDLRIQPAGAQADQVLDPLAEGRGDVFINPFADAVTTSDGGTGTSVDKLNGRILNGGTLTKNMKLYLHLRTPNYSRSRAISDAINSRFPVEYGQIAPTAVPVPTQANERIEITVPVTWYGRSDEFVEVLMHTPIYQAGSEARADGLQRWLRQNPADAPSIAWCLVAIGQRAVDPIEQLYDYPEIIPRLCALKAGAKLDDPLTVPHLITIANDKSSDFRIDAIELLANLTTNPRSMATLRELVNDEDHNVQIAAFEGLRKNFSPMVQHHSLGERASFVLYSVPSRRPMIYVHQQGEPIVVVFGYDIKIRDNILASVWDNRLMIMSNDDEEVSLRVFYEDSKSGEAETYEPSRDLTAFIRFLARSGDYRGEASGLNLNYAQTIGVLYALHEQNAMGGPLVLQQDRVYSAISQQRNSETAEERPETNRNEVEDLGEFDTLPNIPELSDPTLGERPETNNSNSDEG